MIFERVIKICSKKNEALERDHISPIKEVFDKTSNEHEMAPQ